MSGFGPAKSNAIRSRLTKETTTHGKVAEYNYDLPGNRSKVEEYSYVQGAPDPYSAGPARTVEYRYDDIYRLTKEIVTTSSGWDRTISYAYDKVGNRETVGAQTATEQIDVTYEYAQRGQCGSVKVHRLTSEVWTVTQMSASAGPRRPWKGAPYALAAFAVLTLSALFAPLSLLRPQGASRWRRRRIVFRT